MTTAKKPTMVGLLSEASERIGAVPKGERQQNFSFRGIDQVTQAVSGPFRDLGIIVVPKVQSVEYEAVAARGGSMMQSCRVLVDHEYHAAGCEPVVTRVVAEAFDTSDKGSAKAMSVALRISLLQVLMLPTHERDPDADSHERAPERSRDDVEELLLSASTVDELRALWGEAGRVGLRDVLNARRKDLEGPEEEE